MKEKLKKLYRTILAPNAVNDGLGLLPGAC